MIQKSLLFLFTLIPLLNASAQDTANKRTYTTQHIGELAPPTIDAEIDEEAWNLVEWSGQYTEFEPDVGTDPSEQTYMKILYDNKNIYFAFKCMQADMDILEKRMGRRDDFPGDWVEVNIDSYNDDRSAFSFTMSVSGVKGDAVGIRSGLQRLVLEKKHGMQNLECPLVNSASAAKRSKSGVCSLRDATSPMKKDLLGNH